MSPEARKWALNEIITQLTANLQNWIIARGIHHLHVAFKQVAISWTFRVCRIT
jgi:hypothetical protein